MDLKIHHLTKFKEVLNPLLYYYAIDEYKISMHRNLPAIPIFRNEFHTHFNLMWYKVRNKAENLFNANLLVEPNQLLFYVYLSSKNDYRGTVVNHINLNSIIGLYCLEMPKNTKGERDGAIAFYDNNFNEIKTIKPQAGDLLLFNNDTWYKPLPCSTDRYSTYVLITIDKKENT